MWMPKFVDLEHVCRQSSKLKYTLASKNGGFSLKKSLLFIGPKITSEHIKFHCIERWRLEIVFKNIIYNESGLEGNILSYTEQLARSKLCPWYQPCQWMILISCTRYHTGSSKCHIWAVASYHQQVHFSVVSKQTEHLICDRGKNPSPVLLSLTLHSVFACKCYF